MGGLYINEISSVNVIDFYERVMGAYIDVVFHSLISIHFPGRTKRHSYLKYILPASAPNFPCNRAAWYQDEHSLPFGVEVKNVWNYISFIRQVFVDSCLINQKENLTFIILVLHKLI